MTFDSNFWSAIVGAIVGGLISFIVQWANWRRERILREADRSAHKKAIGLSLLFKTIRITSNLNQLHGYLDPQIASAKLHSVPPWTIVKPIASVQPKVIFSAEEMTLLLGFGDDPLFGVMIDLDGAHNALLDALAIYAVDRGKLTDGMKVQTLSGLAGTTTLSHDELAQLSPAMAGLDDLLFKLQSQLQSDCRTAQRATFRLHDNLRKHLKVEQALYLKHKTQNVL